MPGGHLPPFMTAYSSVSIVVFLGPYLLWGALRAANHAWSTPTVGKSLINFFFGSGVPFAIYAAWMLLLVCSPPHPAAARG